MAPGDWRALRLFEFHGWATIRVDDRDDPDISVVRAREDAAIARLREAMRQADDEFSHFDLQRASNELILMLAHGLRNHRYEPVIDLFRWLAAELPLAYGLLYVHDDEDAGRGADHSNEFRVWRVARGEFRECADAFLSPYIPTVEPPWAWPPDTKPGATSSGGCL
jgi:hypothetical protein